MIGLAIIGTLLVLGLVLIWAIGKYGNDERYL